MPKIVINIIAHDGISSLYTGVGRIVQDSINVLTRRQTFKEDYIVNAITGKYSSNCLGFHEEIKHSTQEKLGRTGGKLYECLNASRGEVSYGDISNWKAASISAATIVRQIADLYPKAACLNLCLDTPFANVSRYVSQYGGDCGSFIWIPHSTVLIHRLDSAIAPDEEYLQRRFEWERGGVEFANTNAESYLGYISEYMHRHLLNDYQVSPHRLLDFTNGLDQENPKYHQKHAQKEIAYALKQYGVPTDKKLLFSFGRLEHYKGFEFTIKLGGLLAKKGYQTVLMAQPYRQTDPNLYKYRRLFKEFNPSGIFIDEYSFDLPHKVLQWQATCFLLVPSLAEPFGLIPEEARLYRNPNLAIIVAHTGGLVEQIEDGIDGFFVNVKNLTESYKRLLEIQSMGVEEIQQIARRGYLRAKRDYDLEKNLAKSLTITLKKCRKE